MNIGKNFEEAIKKSVPDYALLYRLPDSTGSFGGGAGLRFSRKNPFDFILWDSKGKTLYALELKTVKGKSISFERESSECKEIHLHQIEGLSKWDKFDGITAGFIIEFRALEKTIFLDIGNFKKLSKTISKKSFTIKDLIESDADYTIIDQKKKRVNYTYDIDSFLSKARGDTEKLK